MKNLQKRFTAGMVALMGFVAGSAQAAIPLEASAAITDMVTDVTAFIASLWPLVIAATVGFVLIKLFKKGTSKAT